MKAVSDLGFNYAVLCFFIGITICVFKIVLPVVTLHISLLEVLFLLSGTSPCKRNASALP